MKLPFVRNPYNYDRDLASRESAYVDESGEVLTQQSESAECDINNIVRRFGITGQLPQGARMPTYGDFDQVLDYRSAVEAIQEAEASFMELPGEIRARFHHDPQAFVEFCSNEANRPQLREWGFLAPEPPVAAPVATSEPERVPPKAEPVRSS